MKYFKKLVYMYNIMIIAMMLQSCKTSKMSFPDFSKRRELNHIVHFWFSKQTPEYSFNIRLLSTLLVPIYWEPGLSIKTLSSVLLKLNITVKQIMPILTHSIPKTAR